MATQTAVATQVATPTEWNEEKLIRAGQRGDRQAVETLFRRYQRQLFQTEEALVLSERNVTQNLIALYKALGGGWESVPETAYPAPGFPGLTPVPDPKPTSDAPAVATRPEADTADAPFASD